MLKKVLIAVVVFSLLLVSGCSGITGASIKDSTEGSYQILRKAGLADEWQVYQLQVSVNAGSELPIVLELASGDVVDGYFYVLEGGNIDFEITGKSEIYKPPAQKGATSVASDRFSFTASDKQGMTYILNFRNTADSKTRAAKITAFVEIILPSSGSIFTPLEAK